MHLLKNVFSLPPRLIGINTVILNQYVNKCNYIRKHLKIFNDLFPQTLAKRGCSEEKGTPDSPGSSRERVEEVWNAQSYGGPTGERYPGENFNRNVGLG